MTAKEFIERLEEVNWEGNKLPCNLTVGGWLDLDSTPVETLPDNLTVGGRLGLSGAQIKTLPDNLTVGGNLYLYGTQIKTLPDNLTVGGWLDLSGTQIKTLPDNLTVGGWLDLSGTQIKTLPDNLTVGGSLYLRGTQIKTLPDNLTVGGDVYLSEEPCSDQQLKHVKRLKHGDITKDYIYADTRLTHIKHVKKLNGYTLYIAPYPEVVATKDHETFAHGKDIREAIQDLRFKMAKKNIEEYRDLTRDSVLTFEEAMMMYRVITGSCQYGVNRFLEENSIEVRDYTVGEILELTHGQYGHEKLREFFDVK
jgi:hypothetical protein